MSRTKIKQLLLSESPKDNAQIMGWVRTRRDSKTFSFLEINDGSCIKNMQVIVDNTLSNYEEVKKITTGSSLSISGKLLKSQGKGQSWEINANEVKVLSLAPENFPLQKKRHSDEFLRSIAHLRPRTNKYSAAFRIRSELSYAIHKFFHDKGFNQIHAPIITASDCEGAGEMFRVTTSKGNETIKPEEEFFGKESFLTVSGQLSAEMFALSLGDVYSFGPTFRAENSNTSRHAAEFWMVEPEMAFCDIHGNMDLAEEFVKNLTSHVLEHCAEDIELFARFVDKSLMGVLENVRDSDFVRLRYEDAVNILTASGQMFEYEVAYGKDLQSEHERYLSEKHFKKPVIVYDYPKNIKAFYMRLNDDGNTVAAMDVLVPRIGELIGGSQREERLDVLEQRIKDLDLNMDAYWWYLDSRRYGSVPHSGFGMGFDRLLMMLTGITNIRDVVPFPRTPNNLDF